MSDITSAPAYDEAREPPPSAPVLQLAGWGDRLAAAVIDFFVRLAITALPAGAGALLFFAGEDAGAIGLITGLGLGFVVSSFVYAPLMMARTNGQTVGHRATNSRVVLADGSRMSGGKAFVREVLVKSILFEGVGSFTLYVLTLLNYLWPLWDANNEALHDKMCTTRVVKA